MDSPRKPGSPVGGMVSRPKGPARRYLDSCALIAYLAREVEPDGHRRWWHVFNILQDAARSGGVVYVSGLSIVEVTGARGRPDYASEDRQDRVRQLLKL